MSNSTYQKFALGSKLTDEQIAFFNKNGFIHFEAALAPSEIQNIINSTEDVQKKWIQKEKRRLMAYPLNTA